MVGGGPSAAWYQLRTEWLQRVTEQVVRFFYVHIIGQFNVTS